MTARMFVHSAFFGPQAKRASARRRTRDPLWLAHNFPRTNCIIRHLITQLFMQRGNSASGTESNGFPAAQSMDRRPGRVTPGTGPVVPGAAKTVCDESFWSPVIGNFDAGLNPALLIVSEFFCSSSISRSNQQENACMTNKEACT